MRWWGQQSGCSRRRRHTGDGAAGAVCAPTKFGGPIANEGRPAAAALAQRNFIAKKVISSMVAEDATKSDGHEDGPATAASSSRARPGRGRGGNNLAADKINKMIEERAN
jgi:hypothetical protein